MSRWTGQDCDACGKLFVKGQPIEIAVKTTTFRGTFVDFVADIEDDEDGTNRASNSVTIHNTGLALDLSFATSEVDDCSHADCRHAQAHAACVLDSEGHCVPDTCVSKLRGRYSSKTDQGE